MDKKIVKIDTDKLAVFAEEGGKFFFKKEAEQELLKLLEIQKLIENLIKQAKNQIAEAGNKASKNFKGVRGENLDAIYRQYGSRFGYSKEYAEELEQFLKPVSYYRVDSDKVDDYVEETGELPEGIYEKDRPPKISFIEKKKRLTEGEK